MYTAITVNLRFGLTVHGTDTSP